MKYLKPVYLKTKYYADIEATINKLFFAICYKPIFAAIKENKGLYSNAIGAIVEAIDSGKIYFANGKFFGSYNSKITREFKSLGAKYSTKDNSWEISDIPPTVKMAIIKANLRAESLKKQILDNLNNTVNTIDPKLAHSIIVPEYEKTVAEINSDFLKAIKDVTIAPELTPKMQRNIALEWGENLELYIKDWTDSNILKLREQISTNTIAGNRAASMEKIIQENYQTSKKKAKFLARQETSLLMSQLREERFKDAGITQYQWSGTEDERERPDHKLLENKIFTWDNPPIVDRATGRRAHPGQDFNCRCIARPIIK